MIYDPGWAPTTAPQIACHPAVPGPPPPEPARSLRSELIRLAAVCCAALEDLDFGQADCDRHTPSSFLIRQFDLIQYELLLERRRQDAELGAQHQGPVDWLMLIVEQAGHLASDIQTEPGDWQAQNTRNYILAAARQAEPWNHRHHPQRSEGDG